MTNSTDDINAAGFVGNMRDAPEEWRRNTAIITKCESEQRLRLAFSSEQSDRIFFKVRIRGDKEDLQLEVQCLAWAYREKVRFVTVIGMVTRNNHSVPYWAEIDTLRREGKLYMSEEYFAQIGFAPERIGAF